MCQGRLPQTWRAMKENVVEWLLAFFRCCKKYLEIFLNLLLAYVVIQPLWTQIIIQRGIIACTGACKYAGFVGSVHMFKGYRFLAKNTTFFSLGLDRIAIL